MCIITFDDDCSHKRLSLSNIAAAAAEKSYFLNSDHATIKCVVESEEAKHKLLDTFISNNIGNLSGQSGA